ncbi:MAG: cytochrome c3 family protein [Desulfobacteria bacterium]
MKGLKVSFIVLAAALITFGLSGMALAFHSGGVAECMGCHNIHDAKGDALLAGTDISSTCLVCHGKTGASSYHIATPDADMPAGTPPLNRTPGGDFGWLKKTYTYNPGYGPDKTEPGDIHGHNIVATDFGYAADGTNATAPGGTMPNTDLSCNSCHDNHGKLRRLDTIGTFATTGAPIIGSGSYNTSAVPSTGKAVGAYRLLRGTGSTAGSGGKTFSAIFNAVAPSTYNRTEAVTPTRVAYGAGVSDWCATCHPDMHSGTSSKMTHPVNQTLGTTVAANYNAYVGSGNVTGNAATSYDSIVPFQTDNSKDYAVLTPLAVDNGSIMTGPASSDRVMCLSCHRAHASGFEYMGRWNNAGEFIAVDGVWPGTDSPSTIAKGGKYAQGRTVAETTKAYNDKPMTYASYQRSLCNKCHAKD